MAVEADHSVRITAGDDMGIPTAAVCECGGWAWTRPDGDGRADTLVAGARAHRADAADARADARAAVVALEARRRAAALEDDPPIVTRDAGLAALDADGRR